MLLFWFLLPAGTENPVISHNLCKKVIILDVYLVHSLDCLSLYASTSLTKALSVLIWLTFNGTPYITNKASTIPDINLGTRPGFDPNINFEDTENLWDYRKRKVKMFALLLHMGCQWTFAWKCNSVKWILCHFYMFPYILFSFTPLVGRFNFMRFTIRNMRIQQKSVFC